MLRAILILGLVSLTTVGPGSCALADEQSSEIEVQALQILSSGRTALLVEVAEKVRNLKPVQRASLALRIQRDGVEFRFRGEFPGGRFNPEMLEYIVSGAEKEHESLLVIDSEERSRLEKIGKALEALRKAGRRPLISYKLVWLEKQRPRVEDLQDILCLLPTDTRERFVNQLGFNTSGLGGRLNVKADPAVLPEGRTSAEVFLTIRVDRKRQLNR